MSINTEQLAHEIKARIQQLSDLAGTDLATEMDDLKIVLLQNPAACQLLLPEDIGMAVAAIKRMVFTAITSKEKVAKERPGKIKVDLSLDLSAE